MSTVSIVVLSILAALLSILLLAAIGSLVYVYILTRKQIAEFTSLVQSTRVSIDQQFDRIDKLIGKVNGDRIQKAAQEFLEQIPKQAQIASRIEKATILFVDAIRSIGGEFEISGSAIERARQSGLGPEDYAPPDNESGQPFFSRSRTAAGDAIALEREAADNSGNGLDNPASIPSFDDID